MERRPSFRQSVSYALEGAQYAFRTQRNIQIQGVIGAGCVGLGLMLGLAFHELALVIMLTCLVLFAELMNTALEYVIDTCVGVDFDPSIKRVKDMAAASVLIVSLGAAALGSAVFFPYLRFLFGTPQLLPLRWEAVVNGVSFLVGCSLSVWVAKQRPLRLAGLPSPISKLALVGLATFLSIALLRLL